MSVLARRFGKARDATVAVAVALGLPVLFGAAAFAIDLGVIHLEQRTLQRAVDAAALGAAQWPNKAKEVASRILAANGESDLVFEVQAGRYLNDVRLAAEHRFEAGAERANAVSVKASRKVPLLFGHIFDRSTATIAAAARAAVQPMAVVAIGSRLASVDPAVLDPLLIPVLGSGLELSLLDYRALAAARVPLQPLLRGIAQAAGVPPTSRAAVVLDRPVALSVILGLAAAELERSGDATGAAIARKASRARASAMLQVRLAAFIGFGDLEELRLDHANRNLSARISVLGLLSGAVTERSIGNAIGAQLTFPGVASARTAVLLGEGMRRSRQTAVGGEGVRVETAQVRARFALETIGAVAAVGAKVALPVELVAAGASAQVVSATCAADLADREVVLAVRTGAARASLGRSPGELADLTIAGVPRPAGLVDTSVLHVEASANLELRDEAPRLVTFRGREIGGGAKTLRTRKLARSLLATLLLETVFRLRVGALTLEPPSPLTAALHGVLSALTAPLDTVVDASLAAAGIGLGEADIRVDDLVCSDARLVG